MISKNITTIFKKIKNTKLVVATKNRTVQEIHEAIKAGAKIIGENRIQEAQIKIPQISLPVQKHFIGHLQTNKVKQAVELFDVIESVDSLRLAQKINIETAKQNKKMPVFLEINIAEDPHKHGFTEKELLQHLPQLQNLSNLKMCGLMTIVPYFENPEKTRPYFRQMKILQTKLNLKELSMGMSHDYKIAIEEGATIIRLGSAIFE